ncbi:cAMP and cAMP-inhibited cGMP 3',5'-cyclic phosphodiesterase 10A-like [Coccinella septempunctata]|uniref:cAMP and cAMP-inhibited cGMP 3',5'-cyclic phosphodiesterase 10A-like n=1 Tax=Coccinella septempunctata TaxID=41139 RepID=UPI001D05F70F|nr:cAMP and cAMP-inhibited cGMP 3',5'-cyclic phosphodiesterase 10A-like [Coccinella septempunctata]
MLRKKYKRLFPKTFSIKNFIAPYNSKATNRLRASRQDDKKDLVKRYSSEISSISLEGLTDYSCTNPDLHLLLLEAADILKNTTGSIGVCVYVVDEGSEEIYVLTKQQLIIIPSHYRFQIEEGKTIAAHVAFNREYVLVEDIKEDPRFPMGTGFHNLIAESVLCVPVVTLDGDCLAVFECIRSQYDEPFGKAELKTVIVLSGWMGAAIHQNMQSVAMRKQEVLHNQLLNITKSYYEATITTTKMLTNLVALSKETIDVSRGSFYVINKDEEEMTADAYEEGLDEYQYQLIKKKQKLKPLVKDRGILTMVAKSGYTINVKDPSKDPRINNEPELRRGKTIKSILCMPIMGNRGLLGIVKLLNKRYGYFTKNDEAILKVFGSYASCSLQYNTLLEKSNKLELLNKIHERMLNLLLVPCKHERHYAKHAKIVTPSHFLDFRWYIPDEIMQHAPFLAAHMIKDVSGNDNDINYNNLMNFMLVARRLYRNNPYHNFEHAFNFMHCMYNILKRNLRLFSPMEIKALLISSICHDIDHGGCTNNFLILTNDNLYQLYNDSPWENYHYLVTVKLIEVNASFQKYDIFQHNKRNNKSFLEEIKEAILSTDLQQHFKNRKILFTTINDHSYEITNTIHKSLLKGLMMTVCDLSGQCKPFSVAKRITENVYREFYDQGDQEKKMGIIPLSMMDRDKENLVPEDQIQFISVIVVPATEMLKTILPNTYELNTECRLLQSAWQDIIQSRQRKIKENG